MEKVPVYAFVSLSSCTCVYENFMEQVQKAITPYLDRIAFEVKDGAGPEGDIWEVFQNSVVIIHPIVAEGKLPGKKYISLSQFTKDLTRIFEVQK